MQRFLALFFAALFLSQLIFGVRYVHAFSIPNTVETFFKKVSCFLFSCDVNQQGISIPAPVYVSNNYSTTTNTITTQDRVIEYVYVPTPGVTDEIRDFVYKQSESVLRANGGSRSGGGSNSSDTGSFTELTVTGSATSTFAQGINITDGCFAIDGVCVTGGGGLSQWTTSGSAIYYMSGKVGIGTTTPVDQFEVVGNISAYGVLSSVGTSDAAAQLYLVDDVNGYGGIDIATYGGGFVGSPHSYINLISSRGDRNAPTSVLEGDDVGALNFYGQTDSGLEIAAGLGTVATADFSGSSVPTDLFFLTNKVERMRIASNGNVGIGTSSPYAKLSVNGRLVSDYITTSSTTATSTFAHGINLASGCFAIDGVCLTAGGGGGSLVDNVDGLDYNTMTGSLSVTLGYLIPFTASTTNWNEFYDTPSTRITASTGLAWTGNELRVATSALGITSSQWTTNGTSIFYNNTGNVGIGTTSPYAKLSVNGTIVGARIISTTTATSTFAGGVETALINVIGSATSTFSNGIDLTSGCFSINGTCVAGGSSAGLIGAGTAGQIAFYETSGSTLSGTSTLSIVSGNVGIGTTSPYAKLSVNGLVVGSHFVATTTATSTFGGGINIASGCFAIDGTCVGNGTYSQWTTSSSNIYFNTGNVGIGTTSPYAKLSVNGTIVGANFVSTTTATSTFGGGINIASGCFAVNGVCVTGGTGGSGTVISGLLGQIGYYGSDGTTLMGTSTLTIGATSNVGIGSTTPSEKLSVVGNALVTGVIKGGSQASLDLNGFGNNGVDFLYGNGGTFRAVESSVIGTNDVFFQGIPATSAGYTYLESWTGAGLVLGTGNGAKPIIFNINRSEKARLSDDGNFGIGTTSPYAKLSVNGTIVGANFVSTTTATSTFGGGIDIASGCFSINSVCIEGGGGSTQWTTNGSTVFYNSGFVGIGTTTPGARLSVGSGDAIVDGFVKASYFISTSTTATSTFAQGINITDGCFAINGTCVAGASGGGTVNTGTQGQVAFYNANGIAVSGTSTLQIVDQRVTVGGTATTAAMFNISSTSSGNLFDVSTTSSIFRVTGTGNVGINAASPLTTLDIRAADPVITVGNRQNALGALYLGNSGHGVMRNFAASANSVGLYTTSGSVYLSANGNADTTQFGLTSTGGATTRVTISLGAAVANAKLSVGGDIYAAGFIRTSNFLATSTVASSTIGGSLYVGTTTGTNMPNNMFFVGTTSARFVVATSTGNVGVGTSTPWRTLSVSGTVAFDGLTALSGANGDALCLNPLNKEVIVNSGAQTCTVSSARYKHDIESLDIGGLDTINALRSVSFAYNGNDEERIGFIAEEVGGIDPRLIFTEKNGTPRGVRYEDMTAVLTKAVQELDVRTATLDDEIITESFGEKILAYLVEKVVEVRELVVGTLRVSDKVCVDDVCVSKEQFKDILINAGGAAASDDNEEPAPEEIPEETPEEESQLEEEAQESGIEDGGVEEEVVEPEEEELEETEESEPEPEPESESEAAPEEAPAE